MEEFTTYLNNLGIAYLVSCAICLTWAIGLVIANWWVGEDIEGSTIISAILVSLIPVLNVCAVIDGVTTLLVNKAKKFSIKGRKKQ